MGKNKLEKFADMASYPHVFEYPYSAVDNVPFDMKGKWHEEFFKNDHPIVLELGCGRGEYTVGLGLQVFLRLHHLLSIPESRGSLVQSFPY